MLAWGSLVVVYGVAYLGAYVRHSSAELACGTDWPLCNGSVVLTAGGAEGAHVAHRLAAFASMVIVFSLLLWARRFQATRPDIYRATQLASAVIVGQAVVGGIVVMSKLSIFATLTHAGLMGLLFVLLCDVARRTITWSFATGSRRARTGAPAPMPAGD